MAYGMGMGGGADSSGFGGLGAGAFGGGGILDEREVPRRVGVEYSFNPNLTNISIFDAQKQHQIAQNLIDQNIPSLLGNPHLDRTEEMQKAIKNATRHAMLVGATNTGFANLRESLTDQEEADFVNNTAMGNFMSTNPGASFEDAIASIGQATAHNNPHGWDPAVYGGSIPSHQLNPANPNYAPSIELIDPVNTTPTVSPAGSAILDHFGIDTKRETPQEDIDALMNDVLGVDLGVFDLDRAMVSRDIDPWGANRSVISSISHSDTEREYAERAAAERALYSQIANQITQAAGQSDGGTTVAGPTTDDTTTVGGSTGGGNTGGGNTGGGSTGGGNTGGCTRPRPKPPIGDQDPRPRRPDPINILVKTLLTPKKNLKRIAPHARESLKRGRTPDYSMLSDHQQDLVRDILNPPKPIDYSNPENRGR